MTRYKLAQLGGALHITVGAPDGDASVIPTGRRHTLRIRVGAAPQAVEGGAWEHGADGFLVVRLGAAGEVRVTL